MVTLLRASLMSFSWFITAKSMHNDKLSLSINIAKKLMDEVVVIGKVAHGLKRKQIDINLYISRSIRSLEIEGLSCNDNYFAF